MDYRRALRTTCLCVSLVGLLCSVGDGRGKPDRPERRTLREMFREEMGETLRGETGPGEEGLPDRFGYDNWFFHQRAYPAGTIPRGAISAAVASSKSKNQDDEDDPVWLPLGPSTIPNGQTDATKGRVLAPVSGRVTAIAVDPKDPNVVYVGGAQGGVWKTTNARSSNPVWTPLTDHEASMATGAIAVDPVNTNILYVGTGEANMTCDSYYGRGILRSTDGGVHWKLLGGGGDLVDNPGPFVGKTISRILIDPVTAGSAKSTTLWASTIIGGRQSTTTGCEVTARNPLGLWRSIDSGQTWEQQNVPPATQGFFVGRAPIQDMALDPVDHEVLYVGVTGGGIMKSTNAATGSPAVYTKLAGGFPDGSPQSPMDRINIGIGGVDAPGTLYAAIDNLAGFAFRLWGLYKSTDAGATWTHIDDGFHGTAIVTNNSTTVKRVSGPSFVTGTSWPGRRFIVNNSISLTVSAVVDGDTLRLTSRFPGATSSSATWSTANYPSYCDNACFYDMTVAVDPNDATGQRVFVGGNPHRYIPNLAGVGGSHFNWRTDDGGHSWSSISQGNGITGGVHSDDHALAFDAQGTVYDGNDGGIWRSDDHGASWTSMNTNLTITQFTGVSTHPRDKGIVVGGTQDNGTNILNAALQPPPKWFHADFGDGGLSVIDQATPSRMFHTYFNQSFSFMGPARSDVGGAGGPGTWEFVGSYYYPGYLNGIDSSEPVAFYAPLAQNQAMSPSPIYFATDRVYRAPDPRPPCCDTVTTIGCGFPGPIVCTNPDSWTAVSPSLVKDATAGNTVSWIAAFPRIIGGREVVYAGTSDGRVAVSSDIDGSGLATWTNIDAAPLPNRSVTSIEPLDGDASGNTAYVTFSGFGVNTPEAPGHVFVTTNGLSGAPAWTDISGDLPDLPVNRILVQPRAEGGNAKKGKDVVLYAATDIGVFRSRNGGQHWKLLHGLPTVAVTELERNRSTGQIVASTYGRGVFQLVEEQD
jgi:hypothetical protein